MKSPLPTDSPHSALPAQGSPADALEALVDCVDRELVHLGEALHRRDMHAIEAHARDLHVALERAVDGFSGAVRGGQGIPLALRTRLMDAGGRVAAQRESLARATVALDRAMDVLLPAQGQNTLYGTLGQRARSLYSN